jgi:hypothetical protein
LNRWKEPALSIAVLTKKRESIMRRHQRPRISRLSKDGRVKSRIVHAQDKAVGSASSTQGLQVHISNNASVDSTKTSMHVTEMQIEGVKLYVFEAQVCSLPPP